MPLAPKSPKCEGCPAYRVGRGFVPPSGPQDAELVLVGQGPGEQEAFSSEPFVGPTGQTLDEWLSRARLERTQCAVGNVVWCWLPGNRRGREAEVEHCRKAHWGPWLDSLLYKRAVVAVGVARKSKEDPGLSAAWAMLGENYTPGASHRVPDISAPIIPIAHPSYIVRGAWESERFAVLTLKRVREFLAGNSFVFPEVSYNEPPPGYLGGSTWEDIQRWDSLRGTGGITVDLETASDHIRLVGMATLEPPHYTISIPFRRKGGGLWWSERELETLVVPWLWGLLADPSVPKVFHNGQAFDVPVLERNGFVVEGFVDDTMLRQHVSWSDEPKDLEYLATLHLGVPGWKYLVGKVEQEGEGK